MTSVLFESALVGLVASLGGLVLGVGLAALLKVGLAAIGVKLPPNALVIAPRTVIVSLVVGTLITVVAAVSPARRASRVAPIEALRESMAPSASLRRRAIVGALVTLAGGASLFAGLFGGISNAAAVVGLGAAFTFTGVAMLSPLVAHPLAAAIGRPFRGGISGKLGGENAMRNPRRTASTAAALMIGLGLVTFVAVFAASLKSSVTATLDRVLTSDLTLTSNQFQPFSPQIAKDLAAEPEFAAVSPFRQAEVKLGTATTFVGAVDPATIGQTMHIEMTAGSLEALSQPDTVLVSRTEADAKHLVVGDELDLQFARTGLQQLKVIGTFEPNQVLNDYEVSLKTFEANVAQQVDQIVFIDVAPGVAPAAARQQVEEVLKGYPSVDVSDQQEFKEQELAAVDQVFAIVYGLLLLSVFISFFGIVNTLGLSIYERVRELGLLRAIGMSRRQVKRMVRAEAVIVAVLGAVLGLVVGILFGWAMQQALSDVGIDRLAVPGGQLVFFLIAAGLLGVVAAIWPARRAAKLNVLEAIAFE
jgi:putative ABC transport system permease protein